MVQVIGLHCEKKDVWWVGENAIVVFLLAEENLIVAKYSVKIQNLVLYKSSVTGNVLLR